MNVIDPRIQVIDKGTHDIGKIGGVTLVGNQCGLRMITGLAENLFFVQFYSSGQFGPLSEFRFQAAVEAAQQFLL